MRRQGILLVDDESSVAEVIQMVLNMYGHEVEVVDNPLKALAKYEPGKYGLIVTDNLMPQMSGVKLAEMIKSIDPVQPVMLLTGVVPVEPNPAVDLIMFKPFSVEDLRRGIAELLERPRQQYSGVASGERNGPGSLELSDFKKAG